MLSLSQVDLKHQSVQRLHTTENRAMSQCGSRSSKLYHTSELEESGTLNMEKFRGNMTKASQEAIYRLDKILVCGSVWALDPNYGNQIEVLRKGTVSHHTSNNAHCMDYADMELRESTMYLLKQMTYSLFIHNIWTRNFVAW